MFLFFLYLILFTLTVICNNKLIIDMLQNLCEYFGARKKFHTSKFVGVKMVERIKSSHEKYSVRGS